MTGNAATADRAGKAGRLKRALGAALAILIAVPVLFAAGFLWFVWRMPSEEVALDRSADGIVVLTGGASRILDGIELLAAGRGKRLLISGVHRGTTTGEIARNTPACSPVASISITRRSTRWATRWRPGIGSRTGAFAR